VLNVRNANMEPGTSAVRAWPARIASKAIALLALVGVSCAPLQPLQPLQPIQPLQPLQPSIPANLGSTLPLAFEQDGLTSTVTPPHSMHGITDSRQAFAALFDQSLPAHSAAERPGNDLWLHGVSPRTGNHAKHIADLKRAFHQRATSTSVLLVPGLLGDCVDTQSVPFGDGLVRPRERSAVEAYGQYADLGLLGIRQILLPGRVSSATNGTLVADAIRSEAARPGVQRIVLVGYSKGTPDAMQALAQLQATGGIPSAVKAMVSVSGAVMGTALAERFDRLYGAVSPLAHPFDCSPSDGHELQSLSRRERVDWLEANPLPTGLRYYSITAYATREEIGPLLRPGFDQLSVLDARNDGQLLASDAMLPRSTLLAEARADHWDVALPRDRHPNALIRLLSSGRAYPREALFRAMMQWVVGDGP
jgi:hypothetical protein